MKPAQVMVIGLGQLGLPVAAALVKSGYEVVGVDPSSARRELAASQGVLGCRPEIVVSAVRLQWVITVLPDDSTLDQVLCGNDDTASLVEEMAVGAVHLCIGTLGLEQAKRCAAIHKKHGQYFVGAPVFGRPDEAWQQDLTALCGLTDEVPQELQALVLELLACIAPRVHLLASPEAAFAVKLAGNLLIASAIVSMSEAFMMAARHGADAALVQRVITGKLFKGPVYEGVGQTVARTCMKEDVFESTPGFTVNLGLKDLALIQDAASQVDLSLPVGRAVQAQLQKAAAMGYGQRDWAQLPISMR